MTENCRASTAVPGTGEIITQPADFVAGAGPVHRGTSPAGPSRTRRSGETNIVIIVLGGARCEC